MATVNQHYVPQFYLRRWQGINCGPGKIYSLNLDRNNPQCPYGRISPISVKCVCSQKNLYDNFDENTGEYVSCNHIEQEFGLLEQKWNNLIATLENRCNRKNLDKAIFCSQREWQELTRMASLFSMRHPKHMKENLSEATVYHTDNIHPQLRQRLQECLFVGIGSDEIETYISSPPEIDEQYNWVFELLKKQIMKEWNGKPLFQFNAENIQREYSPVFYWDPEGLFLASSYSMAGQSDELAGYIFFPLSPYLVLVFTKSKEGRRPGRRNRLVEVRETVRRNINMCLLLYAAENDGFVFSRSELELKKVWDVYGMQNMNGK